MRRATSADCSCRNAHPDFYPRSPCGERLRETVPRDRHIIFLSTLSLRRATTYGTRTASRYTNFYPRSPCGERLNKRCKFGRNNRNFYPRSPCGERRHKTAELIVDIRFLSTLSLRRATNHLTGMTVTSSNFYPRSPCGERHHYGWSWYDDFTISIHALLAESDARTKAHYAAVHVISIHALLAESDPLSFASCFTALLFLSTLSLRRATSEYRSNSICRCISIHALLAESDHNGGPWQAGYTEFLSTLSLRRATNVGTNSAGLNVISIHALLAESDRSRFRELRPSRYFYPRSPCGERPAGCGTERR